MFKSILLPLLIVLAILSGCIRDKSLLDEIKALPEPNGYNKIIIDYIVGNYIEKGLTREEVAVTLRRYGFWVGSWPKNETDPDFAACENGVLFGVYEFKLLFLFPDLKIIIDIGFENHVSSVIKGRYFQRVLFEVP